MHSIHIRTQVDHDGRIELHVPPQFGGQMLDMVVVYTPVQEVAPTEAQSQPAGWPPGSYEATAGAWQGEPLVREAQ
jgi:hypothetical protein